MKIHVLSNTKMGIISSKLLLVFVVLGFLKFSFIRFMIPIPLPSIGIAGVALAAFVYALIAILRDRDRSLAVMMSTFIGLLILVWMIAEMLFPH